MAKNLELTIGPNYIPDWGAWEAIREFIQNALDADQDGHKMHIRRNPNGTLVIRNDGAKLEYSDLVLGSSSKGDGTFRGQYGEGFKLAMMVLCRMARDNGSSEPPIRIKTGAEMWRPTLVQSKNFNTDVLNIEVTGVQDDNGITVYIPNVSEALWKIIRERVLDLSETTKISSRYGDILTDPGVKGQLYVKGLWISEIPRATKYGYNIVEARVDRDRKMADTHSLETGYYRLICDLLEQKKITGDWLLNILLQDRFGTDFESNALMYRDGYARKQICEAWTAKFGNAIAVTQGDRANKVTALGGVPVECSHSLVQIVNSVSSYERFIKESSLSIKKSFDFEEVISAYPTHERVIVAAREWLSYPFNTFSVEFVDFVNKDIRGTCMPGTGCERPGLVLCGMIRISRDIFENYIEFVSVFIHELAHLDGSMDLSKQHATNIQNIGAILFVNTMNAMMPR